jgi:hypothetical protein
MKSGIFNLLGSLIQLLYFTFMIVHEHLIIFFSKGQKQQRMLIKSCNIMKEY